MADTSQKTPFIDGLNNLVSDIVAQILARLGKQYPASLISLDASGTIATVNIEVTQAPFTFPQITCPVFGPQYIRYPLQKGDKGFLVAADAYMGAMSGLGTGTADLTPQGNLASLVFFPVGNKGNTATIDPMALVLGQGAPNGGILCNKDGSTRVVVNDTGIFWYINNALVATMDSEVGLTFNVNGNMVQILETGINMATANGSIAIDSTIDGGNTSVDGHQFLPHTHDDVTAGSGSSGPVTP